MFCFLSINVEIQWIFSNVATLSSFRLSCVRTTSSEKLLLSNFHEIVYSNTRFSPRVVSAQFVLFWCRIIFKCSCRSCYISEYRQTDECLLWKHFVDQFILSISLTSYIHYRGLQHIIHLEEMWKIFRI